MIQITQPIDKIDYTTFLKQAGWGDVSMTPMGADMGLRRYASLEKGTGEVALLMDMSRAGILETGLKEYVAVQGYLHNMGVRVPEIYAHDLSTGLAVVEMLGQQSFGDVLRAGHERADIYEKAVNILAHIKDKALSNDVSLVGYKKTLIRERLRQFVDYYVPAVSAHMPTPQMVEEFEGVLNNIALSLPPCPMGFCHADYHLENLMWCPESAQGYGVIDFQDAFWGFKGYDLLNLLEDARVSVPQEIKAAAKARFCEGMSVEEKQNFEDWYTLMSAHFHCRVIGLFIKFSKDNHSTEFLAHIPRLQGYILNHLKNPVLAPLKEWMARHNIDFTISPKL